MTPERPVGEDDLQALVDGHLGSDEEIRVGAALEERRQLAQRVHAYRQGRDDLRFRLRFKFEEPIPARLRIPAIRASRLKMARAHYSKAAAVLIWLALGALGGWLAHDLLAPVDQPPGVMLRGAAIAREGISAHRIFAAEKVHPVEVRATEEAHLAQWIANRLGRHLPIPDLGQMGFRLLGGRILPTGPDIAAQVMYEDASEARLTLYVRVGELGEAPPEYLRLGEVQAFYWIDDGCGYVVSSTVDRNKLLEASQAVFRQLEESQEKGGSPPP